MSIGLIAREPVSALGVAAMLDLERIPYTRRNSLAEVADDELPLFCGDAVQEREVEDFLARPSLVLCGGATFARCALEAEKAVVQPSAVGIELDEAVWSPSTREMASTHAIDALRIPLAPVCATKAGRPVEVLARHLVGECDAARLSIARIGRCVWSAVDLGQAFVNLTHERYEAPSAPVHAPSRFRQAVETVYYQLPEFARRPIQRMAYSALERRLAQLGPSQTQYPIEASGVLLLELLTELLRRSGTTTTRLSRWPAPYSSAAAVTHDIEPSRYSYGKGLDALLDRVDDKGHPATFGVVAACATDRLRTDQVSRLSAHKVIVHGRTHRGEPVVGREFVRKEIGAARDEVEARLGRSVAGYRSPRLDRSPDLAWALDRAGFAFDSSYPDVDRENVVHFGAGVGLNVPFRHLVEDDDGSLRPSRCLEVPLTAPDCIQPLMGGDSVLALRNTVARKAAFLRATGSAYVALVHAGVFDAADGKRRLAHLDFVVASLRREGVWVTSLADLHRWWVAREQVRIVPSAESIEVRNEGAERIEGLRLVVEHGESQTEIPVPAIEGGTSVRIARDSNRVVSAA